MLQQSISSNQHRDEKFMEVALQEALLAAQSGNYPVGAILVVNGEIVDRAHNRKESRIDSNITCRNAAFS